jgi:hypothetical protein
VTIRSRTDWDPSVLPGFLLSLTGFGVVLLVRDSLSSQPAQPPLGELALAVALLVLFVRIWRANEGSGLVALLFTALRALRYYLLVYLRDSAFHSLPSDGDASWFTVIYAVALLEISVGLWRGHRWARWVAGVVCILSSTRFFLMWTGAYSSDPVPLQARSMPGILVAFFALFWAAIALYLFLPSTGTRFDQMRYDRK